MAQNLAKVVMSSEFALVERFWIVMSLVCIDGRQHTFKLSTESARSEHSNHSNIQVQLRQYTFRLTVASCGDIRDACPTTESRGCIGEVH